MSRWQSWQTGLNAAFERRLPPMHNQKAAKTAMLSGAVNIAGHDGRAAARGTMRMRQAISDPPLEHQTGSAQEARHTYEREDDEGRHTPGAAGRAAPGARA